MSATYKIEIPLALIDSLKSLKHDCFMISTSLQDAIRSNPIDLLLCDAALDDIQSAARSAKAIQESMAFGIALQKSEWEHDRARSKK